MKLLTPISHLFKDQKNANNIIGVSDFLEARERTAELRFNKTTHYHIDFDLNLGLSEKQIQFLIDHVKPREEIKFITFQASKDCEKIKIKNGIYYPNSPTIEFHNQIQNTKTSISQIKNILGNDRSIGIENNNYYPSGAYEICTSTDYICEIISTSNCHLLFDIAHALVTCANKQMSFEKYSNNLLNTSQCKQLHLCQPTYFYGKDPIKALDSHEIPSFELTELSIKLCKKWRIDFLTVEYYKDAETLVSYLKLIKKIHKVYG